MLIEPHQLRASARSRRYLWDVSFSPHTKSTSEGEMDKRNLESFFAGEDTNARFSELGWGWKTAWAVPSASQTLNLEVSPPQSRPAVSLQQPVNPGAVSLRLCQSRCPSGGGLASGRWDPWYAFHIAKAYVLFRSFMCFPLFHSFNQGYINLCRKLAQTDKCKKAGEKSPTPKQARLAFLQVSL